MIRFKFRRIVILVIAAWVGTIVYQRYHAFSNIFGDLSLSSDLASSAYGYKQGHGGIGAIGSRGYSRRSVSVHSQTGIDKDTLALMDAASKGNMESVKTYLPKTKIDGRDYERRTALMYASWNGQNEICGLLLAAGANASAQDENNHTALDYAAGRGLVETVQYLLPHAALNDDGRTLEFASIIRAVYADDIAQLPEGKKLATVNRISPENVSALHLAANNGSVVMVEALIKRGAHIDLTNDNRQTPLHWAAWSNHPELVAFLMRQGANSDAQDVGGNTPLMLAVQNHSTAAVEQLIVKGARKDIANNQGIRPIISAQEKGYADIVALLQ